MSRISYNFGIAVFSRLIIGGIGLFIVGLLTRYLGPENYGYYNLIFAYLFIFSTLADLGLYTILTREISQPEADENSIVSNIFSIRLAVLGGLLLAGFILCWFLPYPDQIKLGIIIAGISAALSSLVQVLVGIFQKYLRLQWVAIADAASRILQLGLVYWLVINQAGLLAFIWAVVVTEAFHFLLIFIFASNIVKIRLAIDLTYWKKTIINALPIAVSLVFVLLYFKLDTILLSLMKPAHDVGVYSVAYKVLEAIIFLPAAYVGLIMPILSRHARNHAAEFKKTYQKAFDVLAIFSLPLMFYLILQAPTVIKIIGGSGFTEAVGVLRVLSIAIMLIFFGNLGGNALVALDLQKKGLWIYLLGAIFNVAANLATIPRFGYYATAWNTVATELIITVALFYLINKKTQNAVALTVFNKSLLASLLIFVPSYLFRFNFITTTLFALLYFPVLYWFKGFSREDLGEIFSTDVQQKSG